MQPIIQFPVKVSLIWNQIPDFTEEIYFSWRWSISYSHAGSKQSLAV